MIKEMEGSAGCIVGMQARGKVTDEDYKKVLVPRLDAIITQYGKARLLFDFSDDFQGYDLAAVWDDATFGLKHRNDFEKCAVVGGPKWVDWGSRLAAVLMNGEVKTFPSGKLDDAWSWIKV